MDRERMEDLVAGYLDRTLGPDETEDLLRELRESPESRRYLLLASHTDLALYDLGRARASGRAPRRRWIAAAACILIGVALLAIWTTRESRETVGRVESATAGTSVASGTVLFAGDDLRVPAGGFATVAATEGTLLRIGPGTTLRFATSREVSLGEGALTAHVTPQVAGRSWTFVTPEAEACVLGTSLRIATAAGSTRLDVEEGKVRLKRHTDGRIVVVSSGHYAVAATGVEMSVRAKAESSPGFIIAPDGTPQGDGSLEKPWDLATALAHPKDVKPGETLRLRGGVYKGLFPFRLTGTAAAPIVVRAFGRERATVDGGIEAAGAWTTFRGFEITNSSPARGIGRPAGLALSGRGHKAINMIVHDTGNPGIGFREEVGDGGEISGCILWGNGVYAGERADQPVGSAIGAQNRDGGRVIRDTIAFRNFQSGIFLYAEKGYADGFRLEGNVIFDHPAWNLLATGGEHPLSRLQVIENFTWSRRGEATGDLVRFGLLPQARNADIEVRNNHFVLSGVDEAFHLFQWQDVRVTGNTIVGGKVLARWTPGAAGTRRWNDNTYFTDGSGIFLVPTARHAYPEWKKETGFDEDSALNPWAPGGVKVVLRHNRDEGGRAHLIVYNWDGRETVDADLSSVIEAGGAYVVRDAQDYYGPPVARGMVEGRPVKIAMAPREPVRLAGDCPHLQSLSRSTAPGFGVFIVERDP